MPKFDVNLYTSARIKVSDVDAADVSSAVQSAVNSVDLHDAIRRGAAEWDEGEITCALVDPILADGEIDYEASSYVDSEGNPLITNQTEQERLAECARNAKLFMVELLESVESLGGIVDEFGLPTLTDLMYLQAVILGDDVINLYPDESSVLEVLERMPSAAKWHAYVKRIDEATQQPETRATPVVTGTGARTDVVVQVPVSVKGVVDPTHIRNSIEQLLAIGQADARDTLNDGEGDTVMAELADRLDIGTPLVGAPRVLVVVSGGIADPVYDTGVDLEVFDWDNYNDDPVNTLGIPKHFADLAEGLGIPIQD